MSVRADLASISGLASELAQGSQGAPAAPPTVDAGPSTAAIQATLAEVLRARAGLIDMAGRTAADLEANKSTYVSTDAGNADLFRPVGAR